MPAHGDLSTHRQIPVSEMHSLLHPSLTNKISMARLQVQHTANHNRYCFVLVCTHGLSSVYLKRLPVSTEVDTENIKLAQKDIDEKTQQGSRDFRFP